VSATSPPDRSGENPGPSGCGGSLEKSLRSRRPRRVLEHRKRSTSCTVLYQPSRLYELDQQMHAMYLAVDCRSKCVSRPSDRVAKRATVRYTVTWAPCTHAVVKWPDTLPGALRAHQYVAHGERLTVQIVFGSYATTMCRLSER